VIFGPAESISSPVPKRTLLTIVDSINCCSSTSPAAKKKNAQGEQQLCEGETLRYAGIFFSADGNSQNRGVKNAAVQRLSKAFSPKRPRVIRNMVYITMSTSSACKIILSVLLELLLDFYCQISCPNCRIFDRSHVQMDQVGAEFALQPSPKRPTGEGRGRRTPLRPTDSGMQNHLPS